MFYDDVIKSKDFTLPRKNKGLIAFSLIPGREKKLPLILLGHQRLNNIQKF